MKINARTLRDTNRILALREALGLEADGETILALAERARSVGSNPVALFRWMLRHPESWAWLDDRDRARARARLEQHLRRRGRPERGRRTRMDSHAFALLRPHRVFQPPPPCTGWQAEAAEITRRRDGRLSRGSYWERWNKAFRFALIVATLLWLFF